MNRARIALVVAGASVLALGLTACEKPNPGASVFSGTTTQHQEALCWSQEGEYLDETSCAKDILANSAQTIPILAGQTIGISVDPMVADIGWYPVLGGERLTQAPVKETYFRFTPTAEQVPATIAELAVLAGDDKGTRGVWLYRVDPV